MEVVSPSLKDAIAMAYNNGEHNFIVFPYFLFNWMHIRYDVPNMVNNLEKKFKGCKIKFSSPIGQDPIMANLIIHRIDNL